MAIDLKTNGKLTISSLAMLVAVITIIVNAALTVNNKVDRDRVQACELKINTLETQRAEITKTLDEIKAELSGIRGENKQIIEKLAGIAAKQNSGK